MPADEVPELFDDPRGSRRPPMLERMNSAKLRQENERLVKQNELLQRDLGEVRQVVEELALQQARLEAVNDRLRAPELVEAVYLGAESEHARVQSGNGISLVSVDLELDVTDLCDGDTVYLGGEERNVIVAIRRERGAASGDVATVEQWLNDQMLLVQSRGESIVVRGLRDVEKGACKAGDDVIVNRRAGIALAVVAPSTETSIKDHIAEADLASFGGADALRDRAVTSFTSAILYPGVAATYGITDAPTILFYGPPGVGKSLLARIIVTEINRHTEQRCKMVSVKGSELESMWVGDTQRRIKKVFDELRDHDGYGLLFIDEVDAIGRRRGEIASTHADRFLATWLAELEGSRGRAGIGVIAATNRRDLMDQALLDRFGDVVRIGRPDMAAATAIFGIHLDPSLPYHVNGKSASEHRREMIDAAVTLLYAPNAHNAVARLKLRDGKERTVTARELISGRLIEQCCLAARQRAFLRRASGGLDGLRISDMEAAVNDKVAQLKGVLTPANAHHYLQDLSTDIGVAAVETVGSSYRRDRSLSRHGEGA